MSSSIAIPTEFAKSISQAIEDPVIYPQTILGHQTWWGQERMLRSIFQNRRTAVAACHASSKTFTVAESLLHWLAYYDDGVVITTAPTNRQVRNLVWREVRKFVPQSKFGYPKPGVQTLDIAPNNYAFGMSTRSQKDELAVRFQGIHGGHVLIIIDEAPGIEADIWGAISGIRAGGKVHVVAIGNPTIPSGPFYDIFTSKRELWNLITFDAFDMPNMKDIGLNIPNQPDKSVIGRKRDLMDLTEDELDDNEFPFLNDRRWVKEMLIEYGIDSPRWESRVRGRFPTQSEYSVFSLSWLEDAKLREDHEDSGQRWSAGIDVAGEGDDETVCYIVDGTRIVDFFATGAPEPRGAVVGFLNNHRRHLGKIAVDKIGIGYNFMLHIRDQGFTVEGINVGEAPNDKEKFFNLKAELYWKARGVMELGTVSNMTDERTISQLASIRYGETPKGQIKIESKPEARKRGVKSPDRAEAFILAVVAARSGRMSLAGIGSGLKTVNPTKDL